MRKPKVKPPTPLERLKLALDGAENARQCVAENIGPARDEAREGYDEAIRELSEAMLDALGTIVPEMSGPSVEHLAKQVWTRLKRVKVARSV